jgi:condensin complex subunit 1
MKHVPRLLCDTDPKIPPMARYFLQELQKKDPRGILNCIPDLMSNLADNHESIVPQIVTYLDKNQADPLLDKLLVIMAETDGTTSSSLKTNSSYEASPCAYRFSHFR